MESALLLSGTKLLIIFLFSSCAYFSHGPENQTATLKQGEKIRASLVVRAVHYNGDKKKVEPYSEMFLTDDYIKIEGMDYRHQVKKAIELIKDQLIKTGRYEKLELVSQVDQAQTPYVLQVDLVTLEENKTRSFLEGFWAGISYGFFGLIPYWDKKEIRYDFTLYQNGKLQNKTQEKRTYTSAFSNLLLPIMPFYWPKDVEGKLTTDLFTTAHSKLNL